MCPAVLQPEQGERDSRLLQFLVQVDPVRDHPIARGGDRRPRKHARFQRGVIEVVGQGPRQARGRRPLQVGGHRPQAHRARLRDSPVVQADVVFEAE